MSAVPAADAMPGSATYAEFWRIRRLVVENNVIELAPTPSATHAQSVGIYLADNFGASPLYAFLQLVLRGNVVREFNDVADSHSIGMFLHRCEAGLIEENVIDPAVGTAIWQHTKSGPPRFFENQTPAGILLQAVKGDDVTNPAGGKKVDELATAIEDAMLLSI